MSILLHPLPRVSLPMDVLPPSHVTKRASPSPAMKVPPPSRVTSMESLSPYHGGATSAKEVTPPSPCHGGGTSISPPRLLFPLASPCLCDPSEWWHVPRGAGTGGLGLAIEGPSEAKMSCKDNKDGSCAVEYVPFTPGDYDVNITFGGHPIPGAGGHRDGGWGERGPGCHLFVTGLHCGDTTHGGLMAKLSPACAVPMAMAVVPPWPH